MASRLIRCGDASCVETATGLCQTARDAAGHRPCPDDKAPAMVSFATTEVYFAPFAGM